MLLKNTCAQHLVGLEDSRLGTVENSVVSSAMDRVVGSAMDSVVGSAMNSVVGSAAMESVRGSAVNLMFFYSILSLFSSLPPCTVCLFRGIAAILNCSLPCKPCYPALFDLTCNP